jgi:outer membrane protein, heavy metal efflux system
MIYPRIFILFSCLFVQFPFSQDRPPAAAAGLSNHRLFRDNLQALIDAAKNNPGLKAADARVQSTVASSKGKRSLDPPQVAIEFYQAPIRSFPNPFKDQMEYDYSIQQMIPFPGKLGVMADAELKRTEMLKADRQTQEQDIVRNVKTLFYELYLKDRQREINHETLLLLQSIVESARKQYEVGMGKQSDILRAQTEMASFVNDSIVLVQQRRSIEGMLNAVCNRSVVTKISSIPEIEPVLSMYHLEVLLALAEKNRPELKSMVSNIEMQQAEHDAARKGYLPDFMVRGMYKQMMERPDDWSLMIGATVPVAPWSLTKYSSGTARADAAISAAQCERDNMRNIIASEVNDALLKIESGKERLKLAQETSIPQARKTLESATAAYMNGKQEFIMLIDIQRMLVMAKLDYHRAVMALLDSQSQLERAVGLNIDEIEKAIKGGGR